jgi:class 3 adenylate cyclase
VSTTPPIRYTKRRDAHIAYQVVGDGPPGAIVFMTGTAPIESLWELPTAVDFLEHIGSVTGLVLFDRMGIGSSDPLGAEAAFSSERHAADAAEVLDQLGAEAAVAIGLGISGAAAICLAADRPSLVSKLVLFNTTARFLVADDYLIGDDPRHNDLRTDTVIWGESDPFLEVMAPSARSDSLYRNWHEQAGRRGASPAVAEALLKSMFEVDIRDRLGEITVPTLILHSSGNQITPMDQAEYLASRIAAARLVELESSDVLPFVGEFHRVAEEIEEFITGVRRGPLPTQRLAVMMFTDIVNSTARASDLGDHQWRETMDRYDRTVDMVVRRFGGVVVKSTGDGSLVTFDTPSAALRAGAELLEAIESDLGLTLRAGVHLGEIESRGSDVTGLAVNVAARVADLAGPGEIWVSESTRRATLGSDQAFEPVGVHTLKGIPDSWEICRLVPDRPAV